METKKRVFYLDNIRLLVIMLVVVMHLSTTYSGMGSWYYQEARALSAPEEAFFSFFQSFLQSFFMGFLFLIAGYFVPRAYDRKGFGKFIKDRAVRLGIPALLYMFVIDPFTEYVLLGSHSPGQGFFSFYVENITSLHFLSGSGPLWFALALLIFTVIYALIRLITGKTHTASRTTMTPNATVLGMLILVMTALAFTIRIWLPIITSIFNMMLCFFAQYIVLFVAGIFAYRYDLFSKLSKRYIRLLYAAPVWSFGGWAALMLACQAFWGSDYSLLNGGLTWQSALYAFWESSTAIAMDVGLLVLFREKYNKQSAFTGSQSNSAFAVYVFHTPIIVAIALLFQFVSWPPVFKFLAMIPVSVPICFAAAYGLTKIPLLKKIL